MEHPAFQVAMLLSVGRKHLIYCASVGAGMRLILGRVGGDVTSDNTMSQQGAAIRCVSGSA